MYSNINADKSMPRKMNLLIVTRAYQICHIQQRAPERKQMMSNRFRQDDPDMAIKGRTVVDGQWHCKVICLQSIRLLWTKRTFLVIVVYPEKKNKLENRPTDGSAFDPNVERDFRQRS